MSPFYDPGHQDEAARHNATLADRYVRDVWRVEPGQDRHAVPAREPGQPEPTEDELTTAYLKRYWPGRFGADEPS
jgi:hypothetical protein